MVTWDKNLDEGYSYFKGKTVTAQRSDDSIVSDEDQFTVTHYVKKHIVLSSYDQH